MSDSDGRVILNDRYEIQRRIGRGGMADVFVARDQLLDRPVAIKVLFPEYATDPAFVERFRREAQAAANLNHPNIVGVYDWGRSGTTYFIAMEYVAGRTLADIVRTNGTLTAQQAADVGIEVASALAFAHRNGVVHRDIKPANILIGSAGQVKVADFGIARALNSAVESNLTQAGSVMGTATYFSPEQAQGAQPDPRSDLYSLGIVLYEAIAGRPPFTGENPVAIAYKQVHDAPQPLNQLVPDVPRPFEAIVARLLAKSPDLRYPTAEAVRDDLKRFREGQPVQAFEALRAPGAGRVVAGAGAAGIAATAAMASRAEPTAAQAPTTQAMPRTSAVPAQPSYPPYEEDFPRRSGWYVFGAIIAVAALVVGGVLLFNYLTRDESASTLTVPNVTNMTLVEATQVLLDAGLNPILDPVPNPDVEEGIVYAQDPPPDTVVREGDDVTLTYNPPTTPVEVPDLTGKTLEEASQALAPLGLRVEQVETREDPTVEEGRIIEQDPPAGEEVRPDTVIQVVVSGGKGQVTVPNVEGQAADAAQSILEGEPYALVVTRAEESSDTVAAGRVTRTDPAIGTTIDKGASVTMYVSTGKAKVGVPGVVDQTEAQARAAIEAAGLVPSVQYTNVPAGDPDVGRVISQSPTSGTSVDVGSTVTLRVGRATAPPTTPAPTTTVAPTTTAAPATTTTTAP